MRLLPYFFLTLLVACNAKPAPEAAAPPVATSAAPAGRPDEVRLTAAQQRAAAFMPARGYTVERVPVQGDSVTVAASDVVDAQLLTIIGIRTFDIQATATADAVTQ